MREYVLSFMKEIGFDAEAIKSLCADLDRIYDNPRAKELFEACVDIYGKSIAIDYRIILNNAEEAAGAAGVHEYSAKLLVYVCLSKRLRELYRERGIDDKIWYDSMSDLKWKLWECRAVKGIWGSFVADWFYGFFNMTRFALGRLQFETGVIDGSCTVHGRQVEAGTKVVYIHIPRTLTPLTRESRLDAYRQAAEMFRDEVGGTVIFACHSWLLSEEIGPMLKEGSNLRCFRDDFEIVKYEKNKAGEYPDAWRLFDMDYTGNIDDYPEDSSLRRNYKAYIKGGGVTGYGLGLFFADDVSGE